LLNDFLAAKSIVCSPNVTAELRRPLRYSGEIITIVLKNKVEQYLQYKKAKLWGKRYCGNFLVTGKELIPGGAINSSGNT